MIYDIPEPALGIDQGDLLDGCPVLQIVGFNPQDPSSPQAACSTHRVVVMTQTCDLANQKTHRVVVAIVHDAQFLVDQKIVKASDIRGPIRAGRVYGWYFLPSWPEKGIAESIVDLRQIHTLPRNVLEAISENGGRIARIQPLYREHLAKHFADTYSRIGLPEPYDTES